MLPPRFWFPKNNPPSFLAQPTSSSGATDTASCAISSSVADSTPFAPQEYVSLGEPTGGLYSMAEAYADTTAGAGCNDSWFRNSFVVSGIPKTPGLRLFEEVCAGTVSDRDDGGLFSAFGGTTSATGSSAASSSNYMLGARLDIDPTAAVAAAVVSSNNWLDDSGDTAVAAAAAAAAVVAVANTDDDSTADSSSDILTLSDDVATTGDDLLSIGV
jgi:hypothetical protein